MNILAIETATQICSVALLEGQKIVCEFNLHRDKAHAQDLVKMIDLLLATAQITPNHIDAIAVSKGPGSYTGLRIGVSTAKGLAFAWDKPLIGIPTFEAMATNFASILEEGEVLCTAFDARRDEVFCAAFYKKGTEMHAWRETTAQPAILVPTWLQTDKMVYFAGNAALLCAHNFANLASTSYKTLSPDVYLPAASGIARAAIQRYEYNFFEDIATFEPYYLKDFIALHPAKNPFEKIG